MKGVIPVIFNKKQLALIFKKNIVVSGVKFLTDELNPFQVGIHDREKGVKLAAHAHKIEKAVVLDTIQELLMVVSGKIRINIFSEGGKPIAKKILTSGDSVLFLAGGHGVDFLADSRVFQVKQGPYAGTVHAKIYIK